MTFRKALLIAAVGCVISFSSQVAAQPADGGGGGGQVRETINCNVSNYAGEAQYIGNGPQPTPLRNTIACVTQEALALQDVVDSYLIYGPFEAGFPANGQFACLDEDIIGGLDTLTAQKIVDYTCGNETQVLRYCGGHATPFHFHEDFSCLYETTNVPGIEGHSSRFATALDGYGIYGKYIAGGVEPTDLDGCGGRWGITPDSNGEVVYYYVVTHEPPFTLGCFGPATLEECRSLYSTCSDNVTYVTVGEEEVPYVLDCPCFDSSGSNVVAAQDDDSTSPTSSPSMSPSTSPSSSPSASPTDDIVDDGEDNDHVNCNKTGTNSTKGDNSRGKDKNSGRNNGKQDNSKQNTGSGSKSSGSQSSGKSSGTNNKRGLRGN